MQKLNKQITGQTVDGLVVFNCIANYKSIN